MVVHLAFCPTDSLQFDPEGPLFPALFSPERLETVKKRPKKDQRSSAAGQWLLRELLRRYAPEVEFPPRYAYGWQEKPFLAEHPHLHFNLSHSGGWAVCALCSAPVGVDIQEEKPVRPVLWRKFAPDEQEWLRNLPEVAQNSGFLDLWAMKEAYCKCVGDGLLLPLSASVMTVEPPSIDKAGFRMLLPRFPETDCHLALCVETEEPLHIHSMFF